MPESEDLLLLSNGGIGGSSMITGTGDLDGGLSFMAATSGVQGLTSLFFKGLGVET